MSKKKEIRIDLTEFIGSYTADEAKVVAQKIAAKLKAAKNKK